MNNVTRTTAPVIKATVFLGLAALLVAGCASKKSNTAATISAPATSDTAAAGTAAASTAATSAAALAPAAASGAAVGASAVAGPAAVDVKTGPLGAYLTDESGHTLYLYTPDTSSTSTCYGQCIAYWPPLLTTSATQAGSGAAASLLGTTKRTDGTTQVTYKSHPLYLFKGDTSAGDMTGQGKEGTWFLVSPAGAQIGHAPAATTPKPSTGKPSTGKPSTGKPSTGKPSTSNSSSQASTSEPAAAPPSPTESKSSAVAGGGWS